jgi:hypothetical protein
MAFDTEERIRVRAYHLWEAHGRPEGRDLEFWDRARQLHATNMTSQPTETERKGTRAATRSKQPMSGARKRRSP